MCILQFHNARDCQQAYNECLQGKEIGGQLLHAEFNGDRRSSSSENLYTSQQYGGNSRDFRRPYAENDYGRQTLDDNNGSEGDGPSNTSCTLTVSNLPYSASERDIVREFPEALRVALSLDEQGRSRGVAHVTFSNSDQCSAALTSCGNKMMGGRPMRGRIQRDQEHSQQAGYNNQRPYHRDQRDYGQRGQRDYNQRNFNNRDHSNQRENGNQRDNSQREYNQRDYSGQRDYANRQGRQFDYNSGRGERDVNRFQSGSANRGGSRDFGRNDRFDWSDQRRDRSPARVNNSAAKSPQPGVAPEPKNKRLTNGKTTPLKPGSKRPVPVGSDDSGSDIETGHVTDLKMSHKKLKLGDTKLEPEKHEIESEEDEDDEVEDDDEDDDDEDDDDEDDEDDTGDDDDEEDEDDDESEEGKTPKNLQAGFSPGPKVMVLGFQGNPGHLRKEFPTCIDVQYDKNKKKAILKFPSLEVRQAAVSEPKFINGRKLKLSLLGGPELKTAMILGVSTDVKESEIKGLFDGVVSVTRDSTSSGNHQQPSITVEFKTATDCEKAISSNATLNGKRITIFLKGIFVDEVSGKKPETIAGLKQDEPPAKRAKAAAVVPGSGKLKVEVLGEVPKVEEISSVEDDDEEEDDDEDESEESDDSDDDDTDDMSASQTYQSNQGTSLAVYNLPCSASETEVQSVFPSAKSVNIVRSHSVPPQSKGMCILQFHNARDCQQAYNECLQGKEIGGQLLHAEFNGDRRSSSSENLYTSQQYGGNSRDFRRPYAENDYGRQTLDDNNGSEGDGPSNTSCTLTVSNLPYSASERDIVREFPEALRVALSLDEQGRSRGVAHVTFSNSDQCSAALTSCGNKMMGGRPMRGRIQRDQEHSQQAGYNNQRPYHRDQRDYGQRGQRDYNQRNFNNRDHSNQRENGNQRDNSQREYNQRDYSGQRDYANRQGRQFDYNSGRGERDVNRFQSGSANRGGSRDFGRNDRFDWSDQRRDRSPARGEPVRGYGSSKGPRITSAVIHRPGNASPSESSSSDED
ncbi:unnamed protein product [Heterobilharzia americana]|nr:unnamed protein product [Heterobilharzia americana]